MQILQGRRARCGGEVCLLGVDPAVIALASPDDTRVERIGRA